MGNGITNSNEPISPMLAYGDFLGEALRFTRSLMWLVLKHPHRGDLMHMASDVIDTIENIGGRFQAPSEFSEAWFIDNDLKRFDAKWFGKIDIIVSYESSLNVKLGDLFERCRQRAAAHAAREFPPESLERLSRCEPAELPAIQRLAWKFLGEHLPPFPFAAYVRTHRAAAGNLDDIDHNLALAYLERLSRGETPTAARPSREEKPASPDEVFSDLEASCAAKDLQGYRRHLLELLALAAVGEMPAPP